MNTDKSTGASSRFNRDVSPSEPGCVNPVDARRHTASERRVYATSTGATRPGSLAGNVPGPVASCCALRDQDLSKAKPWQWDEAVSGCDRYTKVRDRDCHAEAPEEADASVKLIPVAACFPDEVLVVLAGHWQ